MMSHADQRPNQHHILWRQQLSVFKPLDFLFLYSGTRTLLLHGSISALLSFVSKLDHISHFIQSTFICRYIVPSFKFNLHHSLRRRQWSHTKHMHIFRRRTRSALLYGNNQASHVLLRNFSLEFRGHINGARTDTRHYVQICI